MCVQASIRESAAGLSEWAERSLGSARVCTVTAARCAQLGVHAAEDRE